MARHLTRDGRAVIDTWLPTKDDLGLYDGRLIHEWTRLDPETGEHVSKTTSATFEEGTKTATIDTVFDAWLEGEPPRRTSRRDVVRFPDRDGLLATIESAGLAPQTVAGDYDMSPLEADSERVIVVAAKGPEQRDRRRQGRLAPWNGYSRAVAGSHGSDATLRLLLVEDMPQVANYIRSLLDAQSKVKLLDVINDGREVAEQVRELQPDLLIVDALLQGKMNGLQVATDLREAGLNLPIIALTVPTKPIAVGEGMGSTRVLSMPFSGYDFMHLVQELIDEHRSQAPEAFSRVIAIFGAKGGVGATTLAYNIAASIAGEGQQRVALIDGSLQYGDLRALLRVDESAPSILQLPTNKVQKTDVDEVVHRDSSGVHVLLAPPRIEMSEMILARDLDKLISLMRRLYNIVIIDTASQVDDILLAFLDASDEVVQVVTYEAPALQKARQVTQTLIAAGYPPEKIRLLVNRSDSTGGMQKNAMEQYFGRKADFEVVSDGVLVAEANNRGEPFVKLGPDAQITKDVARVAHRLATEALPQRSSTRSAQADAHAAAGAS